MSALHVTRQVTIAILFNMIALSRSGSNWQRATPSRSEAAPPSGLKLKLQQPALELCSLHGGVHLPQVPLTLLLPPLLVLMEEQELLFQRGPMHGQAGGAERRIISRAEHCFRNLTLWASECSHCGCIMMNHWLI